ncbi:MAG: lytic murein transglycosylase, partial [Actinobacillus minor]|nr:lytic murein transglycosylase [Actinobacillus minor]
MWKKSLLAMLMFSPLTLAVEKTATPTTQPLTEVERIQLKQAWLADQQDKKQERERQRTNFLQLLALVEADKLTPPSLALATRLRESLTDYPLIEEADWALMKAKIKAMMVSENELASFIEKYPDTAKRNNLNQIPFEQLYQKQDFSALVAYGKTISATTILNQCRLFSAQYQLLAEQLQLNPELEQAKDETTESVEMVALLTQFDQFWLNNATLPSECQGIEAYWRDKGFKTTDKIKQKAVILFQQDAKKGLEDLITQSQSPELIAWLESVKTLLNQPTTLQIFVENQPLTPENKVLVLT